jgi:hypothetical protein
MRNEELGIRNEQWKESFVRDGLCGSWLNSSFVPRTVGSMCLGVRFFFKMRNGEIVP